MPGFDKIVVAVDRSANSRRAVQTAIKMAVSGLAHQVTLLHIVQPAYRVAGTGAMMEYATFESLTDEQASEGEELLSSLISAHADILEGSDVVVDSQVVVGDRGQAICDFARKGGYNLIIVGRRGVSRVQEVVLGSVSSYVVRQSDLPVLIVQ